MAKHDINTGLYLVAIVGIVAVIGLVVLVMNSGSSSLDLSSDLSGDATKGLNIKYCTDTDGGINYYEKGRTAGSEVVPSVDNPGEMIEISYSIYDSCGHDFLVEYYCVNSKYLGSERVDIPIGYTCEDGALVRDITTPTLRN